LDLKLQDYALPKSDRLQFEQSLPWKPEKIHQFCQIQCLVI
jgi:hypothetical protein